MKNRDKEILVRSRPALLESMDVNDVLDKLCLEGVYSRAERDDILSDTRRRHRVCRFLDLMEKKKTEDYELFLELLSHRYPHLYLAITDQKEGKTGGDLYSDDRSPLQRGRLFLLAEIDAAKVLPAMKAEVQQGAFTSEERSMILEDRRVERRTEAFIDLLETKGPEAYEAFLDALADTYPHVYLAMIGEGPTSGDNDDDDDL